tara:strand:- start:1568 stop:2395 length:828 start_codon:yes stop_codon:yes gene_type:complete
MSDPLQAALDATSFLFDKQADAEYGDPDEFGRLYTVVYNACCEEEKFSAQKRNYEALRASVVEGFERLANSMVRDLDDIALLSEWMLSARRRLHYAKHVFKYLDRFYLERLGLPGVHACGVHALVRAVVLKFGVGRLARCRLPSKVQREGTWYPCFVHREDLKWIVDDDVELRQSDTDLFARTVEPLLHSELAAAISDGLERKQLLLCRFAFEMGKRQDRIEALVSLWRRLSFKVGKIALFLRRLFDEAHYRPSNEGFRGCKRSYEDTLQQYARA